MGKFAEYFKKNQVEITLALSAMNMNANPYQMYDMIRVMSER